MVRQLIMLWRMWAMLWEVMGRMDQYRGDKEHHKEQELLTVGPWEHLRKNAEWYWHFFTTQLQKEVKMSHGVTNHLEKSGKATLNILIIALSQKFWTLSVLLTILLRLPTSQILHPWSQKTYVLFTEKMVKSPQGNLLCTMVWEFHATIDRVVFILKSLWQLHVLVPAQVLGL